MSANLHRATQQSQDVRAGSIQGLHSSWAPGLWWQSPSRDRIGSVCQLKSFHASPHILSALQRPQEAVMTVLCGLMTPDYMLVCLCFST